MKYFALAFIGMIAIALATHALIQRGYYPIAVVDGSFVSARRFDEATRTALHYYGQVERVYGQLAVDLSSPSVIQEIRSATLDKMVENVLTFKELKKTAGKDLGGIVDDKISALKLQNPDIEQAVLALYGLPFERFREVVLVPEANHEVLEGKKFSENVDFTEWLKDERRRANVIILAPDLDWDGTQVAPKRK